MPTIPSIEALMRHARWPEAAKACRELLQTRPTDAKLHAYEGMCLFRLGDYAAAEPCFRRATALEPTFVDAGVKRCQCFERMRMLDEAVFLAREWAAKRPHDPILNALLYAHGNRPNPYRTEAWEDRQRVRSVDYAASR